MAQVDTAKTPIERSTGMPTGILIVQAVLQIIFGLWLLTAPGVAISFLVQVLGIYWFAVGVTHIVEVFQPRHDTLRLWLTTSGILGIIAGLLLLGHPLLGAVITSAFLVLYIAFTGIVLGLVSIVRGFQGGGISSFILGIVSIILGVLIWFNPLGAALSLAFVFGVILLGGGIAIIVLILTGRNR